MEYQKKSKLVHNMLEFANARKVFKFQGVKKVCPSK